VARSKISVKFLFKSQAINENLFSEEKIMSSVLLTNIHKKIVYDEKNKPVEVIVDYCQWQKIVNNLKINKKTMTKEKLLKFSGIIKLKEDPLKFQRRIRNEWK